MRISDATWLACTLAAVATSCTRPAHGDTDPPLATLSGRILFRDANTDPEGTTQAPAAPQLPGRLTLTLEMYASIDTTCPDADAGRAIARFHGSFAITDATFRAVLVPDGVTTPAGCPVPRADTHGVAATTVAAEIPATPESCARFCGGTARAESSDRCRHTGEPVACNAGVVGGFGATCEASCRSAAGIAGAGLVTPGTLQLHDGDELTRGRLGDVGATIVLDHLVDATGKPL